VSNKEIAIKAVKVPDLYDFACKSCSNLNATGIVPINKKRALAHINNPYADKDDVGLIVAYLKDRCIGYIGIMPGLLKTRTTISKVYWLSSWFVQPEYRRTSVGLMLILRVISLKYDLVVCEVSDEAEKIYRALHFNELGPLGYHVIDCNALNIFDFSIRLLRKFLREIGLNDKIPQGLILFFTKAYSPLKKIIYKGILSGQKEKLKKISHEEVNEIYNPAKEQNFETKSTYFYRGEAAVNWMLNYHWLTNAREAESSDYHYYFSENRKSFKFIALKVYDNNKSKYLGYLILSFSEKIDNSILKILDFNFINDEMHQYAILLALKYASMYRASIIEIPDSFNISAIDAYWLRLFKKKRNRIYFCRPKNSHSNLAKALPNLELNLRDGDPPFT
jgi:hypothetical protein